MSVVSWFFKISMHLRNVHSYLTEQKQLPSWSVYVLFTVATIVTGALLGVILVLCIDCVLPLILKSGRDELATSNKVQCNPYPLISRYHISKDTVL